MVYRRFIVKIKGFRGRPKKRRWFWIDTGKSAYHYGMPNAFGVADWIGRIK